MTCTVPRFGEIAAQLAERGYRPVPIVPGEKRPAIDCWPNYSLQAGDERRFAEHATGILTGHGHIALDIDVREPDAAAKLEKLAEATLGPAPRRIGEPPKSARLYRFAGNLPYLATRRFRMPGDRPDEKAHRVEVLGIGKQLVCYGRHPSGKPYQWNSAGDPLSIPVQYGSR